MNLAIIGAGSLGMLWAARATKVGNQVYLFTHTTKQKERIEQQGIWVSGISSLHSKVHVDVVDHFSDYQNKIDMVWLMVKQTAVEEVLSQTLFSSKVPIVFWQNGLGHLEKAQRILSGNRSLYVSVTAEGAKRIDDTSVVHTGKGTTRIGAFETSGSWMDPIWKFLQQMAKKYSLDLEWEDDIQHRIWKKLMVNCVINPLTGIFQVSNGELLDHKWSSLVEQLTLEVVQIATANGYLFAYEEVLEEIRTIAQKTAQNHSSLLQDLKLGRRTEIDSLNGYLQTVGRQRGIGTPLQDAIVELIYAMER
ncbi:ketopantoate reductase family protein [Risungbinella massiliensis]|uniref:ketopantoate reductase family protein n=1 Tax=Risungbinella massiliensis TaxID=1329796 RepID=UPI0005CC8482|nr:2-dehydropantoate 2-reductase [Risungbinella massiliensis]